MASGVAKGVVLAKQTAAEKISKVALSEEKDAEIVSALQSVKGTKQTVTSLSAIVRNLYEAKVNEATYLTQHIPIPKMWRQTSPRMNHEQQPLQITKDESITTNITVGTV